MVYKGIFTQMEFISMILEAKEFRKSGEALFGKRWQTDMARALGLKDGRRVRQWISGDRRLPPNIDLSIIKLLEERKLKIEKVLDSIRDGK